VRVYQFRHFGSFGKLSKTQLISAYFFFGVGEAVITVDVGAATGRAAGVGVGCVFAAGVGVGACSGTPDCKTERVPVIAGNESIRAISIKAAAAPIVILESSVCVPRGPNAVLETELENNAPASALPGCKSMVTTKTTHARMNKPYKV
jgi:hypothetical protein